MRLMTPKRLVKVIFVISAIAFVLMNLSFLLSDDDQEDDLDENSERHRLGLVNLAIGNLSRHHQIRHKHRPRNANETAATPPPLPRFSDMSGNLSMIRDAMLEANRHQTILNLDRFDLVASDSTIVIVVQVHNRPEYLRHLIGSLEKAVDIDKTLLIFSHDFYSDELNSIIANVDFCPVLQIFYPYSMQLFPNIFPGEDPLDCPRNVNRDQAKKLGCQNQEYPDKYGHYREAKYSQTKHHWFWKINHVFDHLDVTRNFDGPVLFIEEDHYLVEDFIPVLRMMYRLRSRACHDCNVITLGTYDKKPSYGANSPKVDIMTWVSSKHNMGMSLTRDVWRAIKNCSVTFCRFDDYNWDWSLHYVSVSCLQLKLRVMIMKAPRIYHIGECGLHAKGKNCDPMDRVRAIESLLENNHNSLYPPSLVVAGYPNVPRRVHKANGGWGDVRDHELCISFVGPESHR